MTRVQRKPVNVISKPFQVSYKITDDGRNVSGCRQTCSLNFKEENKTWNENNRQMSEILTPGKKNSLDC
jgi:hypothetical protein